MDSFEIDGLCLKSVDYKENDKIISLYCGERGKISVNAKGCKSAKAKLKFATSPFCFGKYNLTKKGEKYTLIGCSLYDSFFDLTNDLHKYYAGCVVLEFLEKMTVEGEYNNDLFVLSLNTINRLCYQQCDAKKEVFTYLNTAIESMGFYMQAISLVEILRYVFNNFDIKLYSLKNLINLL